MTKFPNLPIPNPLRHEAVRQKLLLVGILLLALVLRVFLLDAQSLRGDEAYGVLAAGSGWAGLANVLGSTDPHPPLYYALLSLWLPLAGHSEFALRFFSVVPSVLMVAVAYALGRQLLDRQIALIAAFLAAINPFYVWHAQDARMYALLGTLAALSAWLMLMAWRRGGRLRWAAYIAITALALYTHYFAALTLLVQNLLVFGSLVLAAHRAIADDPSISRLIRTVARDPRTRPWVLAQVAVLLLYLPWLVVAAQLFAAFGGYVPAAGLLTILLQAIIGFSLGPALDLFAAFLLTLGFGLLFGIGLLQRRPHERAPNPLGSGRNIAAIYVLVPVLLVAFLSQWRPMFHERYLIGITPFYLLILARGLVAASESFVRPGDPAQTAATRVVVRNARLGLGLLYLVAASGFALSNHYFDPAYAKSPDWRGMTAYLHAHERPGDLVIENTPETAFTYYYGLVPTGGDQAERILLPRQAPSPGGGGYSPAQPGPGRGGDAAVTTTELDQLARQHRRLWLIPQAGEPWDPNGLVQSWLDTHCAKVEAHEFAGVGLALYLSPLAEPGTPSHALDVRFGAIALTGYDLTKAHSTNLPTYYLTLYWRCLGPISADYTVFVHVVRADGGPGIYGQQDSPPARGTAPTSQWQPGQVVVDDIEFAVNADPSTGSGQVAP
ncbi:MAG: glycosyltransferase family 39 protein, partial [Chloroflexi bacterium]|nr:glycosyltransferase family 39 protein [Chloroflexota bacterium]